ncbi:MAG: hypothetical protein BRD48_04435 [Bacteroidetes bacterium QS_9_68_14]|nr:MAG: hypothetical protein BRD48_04435 [Bacteroidetes bacterium QS_9_68_14]
MPLSLGHSPWLLALAAAVAGALTWWAYRPSATPSLAPRRRALLGGLRFSALALVLFLLFEPVWRQVREEKTPPSVAVLLDESESLRVTAAGSTGASPDSAASPRPAVRQAVRGVKGDALDGARLRVFGFSGRLRRLPRPSRRALDSLRFDGPRTNLSAALREAREQLRGENLRAVVLVSDGQYNTGRNPLYQAARSPVPIHTVVVGDTTRRRDVEVRRTEANDLAYTGTQVPVRLSLQADGFAGEPVQVSLWDGGERLARRQITLAEGSATQDVTLTFAPQRAGLKRLTASVARLDGEATYRNNTRAVSLRVLEQKRQVLVLGAAPSPGVSAVRRLLSNDPATEVTARVSRGEGQFYGGSLPGSLAESFDVAVLVGFPGTAATSDDARRVARAVEDGLPALFLVHPQTDLRALRRHFADALPAVPEQIRTSTVQATFAPTAAGRRHPVFEGVGPGARENASSGSATAPWTRFPPLRRPQTRWRLAPDARTLATSRVRSVRTGDPLLVTRRRAGERSGMLLATGTWRWANLPRALSGAASRWPRLLSNLVQWTSAAENDRPVRVEPARPTFAGDEAVRLTGQVYDSALEPVEDASIKVALTGGSSSGERPGPPNRSANGADKRYTLQMQSLGTGRYALEAPALPPGRYEYEATATKNGQTLGTDRGAFAVGRSRREFRRPRANADLMRQIAGT